MELDLIDKLHSLPEYSNSTQSADRITKVALNSTFSVMWISSLCWEFFQKDYHISRRLSLLQL